MGRAAALQNLSRPEHVSRLRFGLRQPSALFSASGKTDSSNRTQSQMSGAGRTQMAAGCFERAERAFPFDRHIRTA